MSSATLTKEIDFLIGSRTEKGYLDVTTITDEPRYSAKYNIEGEGDKVFNYLQVRKICDYRGPIVIHPFRVAHT